MKKAVGYFRVSTNKVEQKDSLKNQELIFMDYIRNNGYEFHKFYIDEAITGTGRDERPAFEQMIADVDLGEFDVIVVKELSRLSRNVRISTLLQSLMIETDVRLISIDGQVDTYDDKKNEDFALYAWLYQKESHRTSTRIKGVYKVKQQNGEFLGSIPPYGYLKDGKKLVKRNDNTEDVVKSIYSLFLKGWGQDKIARYIENQGHPTPAKLAKKKNAGNHWYGSTIKKILENYHYLGHLVQHRETSKDISTKSRRKVPKDEMIWVYNTHEPIIDEITFTLVQTKLEYKKHGKDGNSKGRTSRSTDNRHLFTGFMFCGECGSPYWWKGHSKGYFCGARIKRGSGTCDNVIVREQQLINLIKRDVQSFLSDDINVDIDANLLKERKKSEKRITGLTNKIESINQKKRKYVDLLVDEVITKDDYKTYVVGCNNDIEKIQQDINSLSQETKKERLDISSIKSQLDKALTLETFDRELINLLINRIDVYKTGELKVHYTFALPKVYTDENLKAIS